MSNPQRTFRFTVNKEEIVTISIASDNPIFSDEKFAALTPREKYLFMKELYDTEVCTRNLWDIVKYFGEVDKWQG